MLLLFGSQNLLADNNCRYSSYQWNTIEKKAVGFTRVSIQRQNLPAEAIDSASGCSICEQDQIELHIPPIAPFKVCYVIAEDVEYQITQLLKLGHKIDQITGYRVGKTRGAIDSFGNRTVFSNHSFGTALDINPQHNGLYDNCLEFNTECRLIRGGHWRPDAKRSLNASGAVVQSMRRIGLRWGGEIAGKQKDFMHFSPSGY